jgi:hypothetical protein
LITWSLDSLANYRESRLSLINIYLSNINKYFTLFDNLFLDLRQQITVVMKVNTNKLINGIIIAFVLLFAISAGLSFYLTAGPSEKTAQNQVVPDKTIYPTDSITYDLKPIAQDDLDDADYFKVKQKKDNALFIRSLRNGDCDAGGVEMDFIGAKSGLLCDTCSMNWFFIAGGKDMTAHRVDYVKLNGWGIKGTSLHNGSLKFHVTNHTNFIRKVEYVIPVVKTQSGGRLVHEVDEPVKFRYNEKDKCLLIPVSKTTERFVSVILCITGISAAFYSLYLVACFLKFIVDISKGQPFTVENVKRLKIIAFSLLIYPFATFLLNLLCGLIFYSYFSEDVVLNGKPWDSSWKLICLGLVFLALYNAFRQGKKLKEEQDLVI